MKPFLVVALVVCPAAAQVRPRIGDINIYGLHKVAAGRILAAAGVRPGGPLPASKGALEEAIEKVPGVLLARAEGVCCEGPDAALFIGIEERGAPHPSFLSPPAGSAKLPQELIDSYDAFLGAVGKAAAQGRTTEDLTAGHSIMDDPAARAIQSRFLDFAADHLDGLRDVLHHGPEPEERSVAAAVIGYAPGKAKVADDLQSALQDPDEAVRANALRALTAIAVYSAKHPDLGIRVSATWMVELLNSIVLNDRLDAVKALVILTDSPNPTVLALIRERGLSFAGGNGAVEDPALCAAAILDFGRAAVSPEPRFASAWEKGDREAVIGKALR